MADFTVVSTERSTIHPVALRCPMTSLLVEMSMPANLKAVSLCQSKIR